VRLAVEEDGLKMRRLDSNAVEVVEF